MGYGSIDECDDMTDLEWKDGSIPNKPSTAGLDLLNETEAMNKHIIHDVLNTIIIIVVIIVMVFVIIAIINFHPWLSWSNRNCHIWIYLPQW